MLENMSRVPGIVCKGHRVASGQGASIEDLSRYPQGTLSLQFPQFIERGLDLQNFYQGTINVSIAPHKFRIIKPEHCFRDVCWDSYGTTEDFSFLACKVVVQGQIYNAYIYYPHPETKPCHFQDPQVLEILSVKIPGIEYDTKLHLEVCDDQIIID